MSLIPVAVPDIVTRAGIGALVGRTRKRLAVPNLAEERAFAAGMIDFLATEGLFGHAGGDTWRVTHDRLRPAV